MRKLFYEIEVRDRYGYLYKKEDGHKVTSFKFEEKEQDENLIHLVCQHQYNKYKAVCKEGSLIEITVRYHNTLVGVYSLLYSFYGAENKFIKH